jgi:protocatechuate 3,4-dioxygenase beta subunit/uncharacterized protein (DUF2141 family)
MLRLFSPMAAISLVPFLVLALFLAKPGYNRAFAQASPAAPDAPGTISGRVTDDTGAPLANIEVQLFQLNDGKFLPTRLVLTDAGGNYRATLLIAGSYRLGFSDPSANHALEFYPDAPTLEEARTIPVVGNEVSGVNVTLVQAGAIQGVIAQAGGDPLSPMKIVALTRTGSGWRHVLSTWMYASGAYTLTALAPGSYAVCAFPDPYGNGGSASSDPKVCYDDVVSALENAQPVTVTAGAPTTGIDLTIGVEGDGATIGGAVRAQNGDALPGIEVSLYRQDEWLNPTWVAITTTDTTGRYEIRGLGTGRYFAQFHDPAGPYLPEFYTGALQLSTATPITVERQTARLDIDAAFVLGGVITGQVRLLGQDFPDKISLRLEPVVSVYPYAPFSSISYDRRTGIYRLGAAPAGRYRLFVSGFIFGVQGAFWGHYDSGSGDPETASVITVTPGAMLENIDVDLGGGFAEGVIAGRVTANGSAQPGIKASLYPAYTASTGDGLIVELFTDADGRYHFGGVPDGNYHLLLSDPAGLYATSYYSGANTAQDATLISITDGQKRTDIDADLRPGGAIAGRLIQPGGEPVVGYQVRLLRVLPEEPETLILMPQSAVTGDDSDFRIPGLPAGRYRICTASDWSGLTAQGGCYGAAPGETILFAADVTVQVGVTTSNIVIFVGDGYPRSTFMPMVAQ